ncbi:MAG: hypothetical protein AAGA48_03945 [Myxococcota bacterium]
MAPILPQIVGTPCVLTPALTDAADEIRIGPDGVLWVQVGGELFRYEADGEAAGCSLQGTRVWQDTGFDAITDFDLDDAGRPTLLVFFSEIVRLSTAGAVEFSCEGPSGQGVAVSGAGDRAYIVPVGADTLTWVDIGVGDCAKAPTSLKLASAISTAPVAAGANLAVDHHDPSNALPPAVLIDVTTGAELTSIGLGTIDDQEMAAVSDIVAIEDGFLVAESPGGDLWRVATDGTVAARWEAEPLLGFGDQDTINIDSIAVRAGQQTYLSASFLDTFGIWAVDLPSM